MLLEQLTTGANRFIYNDFIQKYGDRERFRREQNNRNYIIDDDEMENPGD